MQTKTLRPLLPKSKASRRAGKAQGTNRRIRPYPYWIETEEELIRCAQQWQQHLNVKDWAIAIRFADPEELPNGVDGRCKWQQYKKLAFILIKPRHLRDENHQPGDDCHEIIVIHELLHLVFEPIADKNNGNDALIKEEERIVDALGTSIYRLTYGINPP